MIFSFLIKIWFIIRKLIVDNWFQKMIKKNCNWYTYIWDPDRATQFIIVPSHHRVWVDGAMTRWCDDDGAIVRWRWRWRDGTTVRWIYDTMTTMRYNYGNEAMLYRAIGIASSTIIIASSHHRTIGLFCTCAVSKKMASDVNSHWAH